LYYDEYASVQADGIDGLSHSGLAIHLVFLMNSESPNFNSWIVTTMFGVIEMSLYLPEETVRKQRMAMPMFGG
jgi:hypothetical protein